MNSNACRSIGRSCGKHAHAGVADDDRHRRARRRSSARSGPCRWPGRRRRRSPSPGRPPRSTGRRGGLRSAGWSCCKSLRERRRPCRPRPAGNRAAPWARRRGRLICARIACSSFARLRRCTSTRAKLGSLRAWPIGDLLDAKRAAGRGDQVEHLGQDQAVDDVAADLDVFDERRGRLNEHAWYRPYLTSLAVFLGRCRGNSATGDKLRSIVSRGLDLAFSRLAPDRGPVRRNPKKHQDFTIRAAIPTFSFVPPLSGRPESTHSARRPSSSEQPE